MLHELPRRAEVAPGANVQICLNKKNIYMYTEEEDLAFDNFLWDKRNR